MTKMRKAFNCRENPRDRSNGCNHPLAVMIDPTASELREFEAMLARCPNCSQWTPGDGPIMVIISSMANANHAGLKEFS
jgi:hypothetical protein